MERTTRLSPIHYTHLASGELESISSSEEKSSLVRLVNSLISTLRAEGASLVFLGPPYWPKNTS